MHAKSKIVGGGIEAAFHAAYNPPHSNAVTHKIVDAVKQTAPVTLVTCVEKPNTLPHADRLTAQGMEGCAEGAARPLHVVDCQPGRIDAAAPLLEEKSPIEHDGCPNQLP